MSLLTELEALATRIGYCIASDIASTNCEQLWALFEHLTIQTEKE